MLSVKNLTKIYGKRRLAHKALNNVSINFPDKGFIVILGKSGCGKSTLLNILGGLDRPTSGDVFINGKGISGLSEKQLDDYRNTYIGFVFQNFNIIENRTVYENIEMTLKLQNNEEDVNYIDDVLNTVGLSGLGYRKPAELSGGQRQKVAIARALIKNPDVILADEPTGSLDSQSGDDLFSALKKLSKSKLVIVVTHDVETAFRYGDRIISLEDGKIVSDIDRKRSDTDKSVSYIRDNIMHVRSGTALTAEEANSILNPECDNYLTFETNKRYVVLSYPDTLESIDEGYKPGDFTEHVDKDVKPEKPFMLRRAVMSIKNCLSQAGANIKKRKRKFAVVLIISILCMTLFQLGLTFAISDVQDVISDSVNDYSVDFITVREKGFFYHDATDNTTVTEFLKDYSPGYKYNVKSSYTPMYMQSDPYISGRTTALGSFIEYADYKSSGLTLLEGAFPECFEECLISDYIADLLVLDGFLADEGGKYALCKPASYSECVGSKIVLNTETGTVALKIAGIFDTEYEIQKSKTSDYSGLTSVEYSNFVQNMINDYYSCVFVNSGFTVDLCENPTKINYNGNELEFTYIYDNSAYINSFYSAEIVTDPIQAESFLYIKEGFDPSKGLADDEIAMTYSVMSTLFYEIFWKTDIEMTDENFVKILESCTYNISGRDVKIVAVTDSLESDTSELYINENLAKELYKATIKTEEAVFAVDGTNIPSLVSHVRASNFDISCPLFSGIIESFENLSFMKSLFFFVAAVLAFFVFITVLNFVNVLIRERSKEIGIMRALGASNNVTLKVFIIELFALDIIVMIVSSIIVWISVSSAVNSFGLIMMIFFGSSLIRFIKFSLLEVAIAFLVFSLLLFITAFPLLNRFRKRQPIDIITSI